jgi:anti-sigma factor RsiW
MNGTDEPEREVEELLPWHAAGTLSRRDAQRVEQALASDPALARRYEMVREELAETIRLNETLGAPSARAMETLLAKIEAEPARLAARPGFGARVRDFIASLPPRTLAWSAAAAALVIVLQAGLIANLVTRQGQPGQYETASVPAMAPGAGTFLLVRFAPQATFDDISTFLDGSKFSIVAGPAGGGLYTIRVAETALPKNEIDDIVKKMQNNRLVSFAAASP